MQSTAAAAAPRGTNAGANGAVLHFTHLERLSAEELLSRCNAGDADALRALLSRYERSIYHLAYRLSGNYDDANDIAAQAYLRICQVIGSCRCAVTLPAWINRIVANVFYDNCRKAQRNPAISLDALAEKTNGAFMAAANSRESSPEAYVEGKERTGILNRAIAALPSYQRQMVNLFYREDRTYGEIADIMGVPIGTVKSRLNRARMALQEKLA